ncbi:hypothetical protein [Sphaerisporangium dianthi]|uniref:Uncharacterized protein n=1 Tax=Sphaerisporangium dianthi TaxID=1436120 RepID=A0ABV9CVD5_9ACTN
MTALTLPPTFRDPTALTGLADLTELSAPPVARPAAPEQWCGHWSTSAGRCTATGARLYIVGPRCPQHTPAALAGEPEPGAEARCPPARCWCGRCAIAEAQVSAA